MSVSIDRQAWEVLAACAGESLLPVLRPVVRRRDLAPRVRRRAEQGGL